MSNNHSNSFQVAVPQCDLNEAVEAPGKFVAALRTAFHDATLEFHGQLAPLAEPRAFAAWLRLLFRQDWVVYSKPPFGGPEHVLRYLGAYTHRVAISNHRLLALADGHVRFRWRDSAHNNRKRVMTLPVDEFLRRFLLHLLPRGFMHIREYQAQLFTVRKLAPGSVTNHLCALRFFYVQTLKRPWSIAETPYPKKRYRLPTILSQEEVAQVMPRDTRVAAHGAAG